MRNRVLLTGILLLLSSGILRAGDVKLISADAYLNQVCNANGVVDSMSQWFHHTITTYECDVWSSSSNWDEQSFVQGWASAVFSHTPSVGLNGGASAGNESASYFGQAILDFSVALVQTDTPPEEVPDIPIIVKADSQSWGEGNYSILNAYATIYAPDGTPNYLPLNSKDYMTLIPGATYKVELSTGCMATVSPSPIILTAGCRSFVDPAFQFDQADFKGGFNLADYYSFEYSSNLTASPIPEPSSLILLGTLLGLSALAARSKRHA
jgi:hypothetical protein